MDDYSEWRHVLSNTDIETAQLIVQLQLQDSRDLRLDSDATPDARLAAAYHANELRRLQIGFPSRHCAEDLEDNENEIQEALEGAAFGWKYDEWNDRLERVPDPPPAVDCTACGDRFPADKTFKAPCDHHYCQDCLENLYNMCMTDETLFPPRCCQKDFPYQLARHHLSQWCRSKFGQKRIELETKDRTYCHVSTCSIFLGPASHNASGEAAECGRCSIWTCTLCKGRDHRGQCPRDKTMDMLRITAAENEWQQCFGCRRIIELKTGCNHITCVCKSQFCYECGIEWKNCDCDQWDEDRLEERAEAAIDLEPAREHETDEQREVRVQRAVEHLRDHHNCEHERFKGIRELGREYECAMCGENYVTWIYQCRQCMMIACNTCRRHRL